jgi:hypothetical protein
MQLQTGRKHKRLRIWLEFVCVGYQGADDIIATSPLRGIWSLFDLCEQRLKSRFGFAALLHG